MFVSIALHCIVLHFIPMQRCIQVTLWNDMRMAYGLPPLGFINPMLYAIAKNTPEVSSLVDSSVGWGWLIWQRLMAHIHPERQAKAIASVLWLWLMLWLWLWLFYGGEKKWKTRTKSYHNESKLFDYQAYFLCLSVCVYPFSLLSSSPNLFRPLMSSSLQFALPLHCTALHSFALLL